MVNVYDVQVEFYRKVQAREYEPVEARVRFKANLEDGADHKTVAEELIQDARITVITALKGGSTTEPTASKETTVTTGSGEITTTKETKTRRGSKAKAAEEQKPTISSNPEDRTNPADDVPGDEPQTEKPKASTDDVPGDVPTETGMTKGDLQTFILEAIKTNKTTGARVKEILAAHGAKKVSDLNPLDVAKVKSEIEGEDDDTSFLG